METSSLIILAILVILISIWITRKKGSKFTLPGPTGLPLVGYLPFMTRKPYIKLTQLSKTYGPMYRLKIGSIEILVLCDFKLIKNAFQDDAFMGRPPDMAFEISEETRRTGAMLGMPWKEQRRFSLHMLRDLGFGKTRMEEHIKEEILELLERMSELAKNKKPIKMSDILTPSMSNNVASFIFGNRLKYDDPKRQRLDHLFSTIGQLAGTLVWQVFFPWAKPFVTFFRLGNQGKLDEAFREVSVYCRKEMEAHEATLDENNIRDFMDGYLLEIQKRAGDPNTSFKKDVLIDLSRGFFGAGSETVRISVDWMLLVCAAMPEVQKKIRKEIEEVLGTDRFPGWQDHLDMPYTEAAIYELMRWRTIIPMNLMRYTLKDTELNGHHIPKHVPVMAVIWAVHYNESLWGKDVHVYKPERFLSEDGKKVVKPEYFIPFSIGKRACPGKALAEIEVFLYVVAILQKFEVSLPPNKEADFEGILGIGLQPKRQDLHLKLLS